MADCFSLPNAVELVKELEHLLSLNDKNLAALVLRNNDVQNAIIYAGDAIEALMRENAKLKAERDAILKDLKDCGLCVYCKHYDADAHSCRVTKTCIKEQIWEWRGVQDA